MKYISTRGGDRADNFEQVIMKGLASDGGLFVPETYPAFSAEEISSFKGLSYHELAYKIISPYVEDSIPEEDLKKILSDTYNTDAFRDKDIAPLKDMGEGQYILELFHGPTLAFKDFALQLLGRFFDYFLDKTDHKINILGATSGDTGSAAILGCAGRENINIFILHPHEKVSEVQRRQMTTVLADNVFNIALKGSFDDCQNIVKELFSDAELKQQYHLSAVNSINWGRIVAQVVYYFYAALQLGAPEKEIGFSVPTGNFGDILAGWIAKKMGLPIDKLVIATNQNDILHRFLETGEYSKSDVHHTISPSMDIQISSNFERLLFEYHKRDAETIKSKIKDLNQYDGFTVDGMILTDIREDFASSMVNEDQTSATIKDTYAKNGEVLDPHTAIGFCAALKHKADNNMVSLATAHPAKFPDAVKDATDQHPELPTHLSDLFEREERYEIIKNSAADVASAIKKNN